MAVVGRWVIAGHPCRSGPGRPRRGPGRSSACASVTTWWATSASAALGVVDDVDAAQERLHRQPAAVARAATGGQDVVGPGDVVAQADRRVRADEDRAGVADPRGDGGGVAGLDLQVLGGVGVDDGEAGVEVVDQDDAGLRSGERLADPLGVLGGRRPGRSRSARDGVGERRESVTSTEAAWGSCSAWLTRSAATWAGVGGVVGEDRDLGRARPRRRCR